MCGSENYLPTHSAHLNEKKRYDECCKSTEGSPPENLHPIRNMPSANHKQRMPRKVPGNNCDWVFENFQSKRLVFQVERRASDSNENSIIPIQGDSTLVSK